jgi:large subunit ribosomal protein L22
VVNEGTTFKRFTPASMGRATPIHKRTSHVAIRVVSAPTPPASRAATPRPAAQAKAAKAGAPAAAAPKKKGRK